LLGRARPGEVTAYYWANLMTVQDECKIWPYAPYGAPRSYGVIRLDGKARQVHALACEAWHGPRPKGKRACHGPCANPRCWNGAHLSWKTNSENLGDDMRRDGTIRVGLKNPNVSFTPEAVVELRRRYAAGGITMQALADEHGVGLTTVFYIIHRITWKEVE
jgi:hypothetical protein